MHTLLFTDFMFPYFIFPIWFSVLLQMNPSCFQDEDFGTLKIHICYIRFGHFLLPPFCSYSFLMFDFFQASNFGRLLTFCNMVLGVFCMVKVCPWYQLQNRKWAIQGFILHFDPKFVGDLMLIWAVMQGFTQKIVEMMKAKNLFESQGGPIILSHVLIHFNPFLSITFYSYNCR